MPASSRPNRATIEASRLLLDLRDTFADVQELAQGALTRQEREDFERLLVLVSTCAVSLQRELSADPCFGEVDRERLILNLGG